MNKTELDKFRNALWQNKEALLNWLESDSPDDNICLAGSKQADVNSLITEIKHALDRVECGVFGKCDRCDGDVEIERLEADFTCSTCLTHYTKGQIDRLEKELSMVSKVQRDLLPCKLPSLPGIQIAAHTQSAGVVGGDYYDFFTCPRGTQGLAIADVMDKGLPAGVIVSNLQASLRILGEQIASPDELMTRLNGLFKHNLNLVRFFSIFIGNVDLNARSLVYCNGGHHPPIWFQAATRELHWLCPTGPAIGLTQNATYHSETIPLNIGDILVLFTDGLVETLAQNGKTFDEKKLAAFVRRNHNESADAILKGLLQTAQESGTFQDDVTLIVVRVAA